MSETRREDGVADVVTASYYIVPAGHCVSPVLRLSAISLTNSRRPYYCDWYARSIWEYEFDIFKFPSSPPVLSKRHPECTLVVVHGRKQWTQLTSQHH